MLHPLDVDVSLGDESPLSIKFCIELSVLSLSLIVNLFLLVNLGPQSLDEADVAIDSGLVVLIHPSFVFVETAEILLQVQQLILKTVVVPFALSQLSCLGHELGDETLLLGGSSTARGGVLLHANCWLALLCLGWLLVVCSVLEVV